MGAKPLKEKTGVTVLPIPKPRPGPWSGQIALEAQV